uniref:Calcineurin-like phosphoesterase n=1 Tax=Candidatus Kentrum eta TaxID=2126337 RepID=A0A450UJP5_9GAMM|nr:MAG: Calcineurin-like phosphoesterase [Candidatus Kentron sp. H]VFJ92765.1 MAG: Calcineurin-like phosphoesterase [Candidatus Kentron sp. H]VFJ97562.1 MAG: Calcineurin-like phosphoesterase [Candidatus Kentron sp. H]
MPQRTPIRWLHLSDFHTGRDDHGQRRLFQSILNHIADREPPDFVFITGDIAQDGLSAGYDRFGEEFLLPLVEKVGKNCPILMVPGNHDVNRNECEFVSRAVIRRKSPEFFDPMEKGLSKRRQILPRFAAYRDHAKLLDEKDWLESESGCFARILPCRGIKLGLLGLNTAWFSEDDDDQRQLTPGKPIVEAGLEAITQADLKIVLGHHPLNWFLPENEEPIRALFGQHFVLYLHGHLHKTGARFKVGAGHPFLTLQSGVAFQAREDEKWVSGLLWAELDWDARELAVEPYQWNKGHQEWALDGGAFPETYRESGAARWVFPLPGALAAGLSHPTKSAPAKPPVKRFKAPPGWEIVDRAYLASLDTNPDEAVILSYFDGRQPNLGLALCPRIPRRAVVGQLAERIVAATGDGQPTVNMLLGAGGEGKSTAFLQTMEAVVQGDAAWRVLYRRGEAAELSRKWVDELPQEDGQCWLIASDDADLIAQDVYHLVSGLRLKDRSDVHFLLCARHTEWRDTKILQTSWARVPGYHEEPLRGLDEEDAARIVAAWEKYQDKGLGRLAEFSREEAVKELVAASRSETSQDEGAFLGALLRLRLGDEFKGHVKKLLDRLNGREIPPGNRNTLLDAFAYIAAMHAENKPFLSKLVLAHALRVEPRELRTKVLWPLGEEAAADVAGEMVFTRHRAIAEAALDILKNTTQYPIEPDELYVDLVRTAEELYGKGHFIISLGEWRYLSDRFFEKGEQALAIKLAQSLVRVDPTHSHVRVKLSQLFRRAGQPEQSLRVFRAAPRPDDNRAFFHEWATVEGNQGNHALAVWLDAVALADDTARRPPDNRQAAMYLAGFAFACRELFGGYNKPVFIAGCGAAGQLGLSLPNLDTRAKNYFLEYKKIAHAHGITDVEPPTALGRIRDAAIAAYTQREGDLQEWVQPAPDLTFQGLESLLGIG